VGGGVAVGKAAGLSLGWVLPLSCPGIVVSHAPCGWAVIGAAVQERCVSRGGTGTQAAAVKLVMTITNNTNWLLLMIPLVFL
jgi:hypothetical protein